MMLHANYAFLFAMSGKLLESGGQKPARVLDYGCGKGLLVQEGIAFGMDFYGVELFGHGSGINIKEELAQKGLLGAKIMEIVDEKIPFPDQYFDLVAANQVLEHIPDTGPVLQEIVRVLKPGGRFLCITPYKGSFREGHCEIPFAHWFRGGSTLQYCWLYAFKLLGFGRRKHVKDPGKWAVFFATWLKENTFYDSFAVINKLFKSCFAEVQYIEEDYLEFRLLKANRPFLAGMAKAPVLRRFSRWFVRKYGGLVILARKAPHSGQAGGLASEMDGN